jgi:outer membrane protein OmpA-like peptidoglycan-associated protein
MRLSYLLFYSLIPFWLSAQNLTFDSLDLIQSEMIFFDFGQFELRPEADSILNSLSEAVTDDDNMVIHLTAHTDAIGSDAANQELSQNRAASVKNKLMELGLRDSILLIQPFGESQPIADNDTDEGRQKNRRVTIDLYQKTTMTYLKGQVKDPETGEGISAKVIIRQKAKRDSILTDSTGVFRFPVKDQTVVGLDIYAQGYFFETQMLKVDASKQEELKFELPKAEVGASVDIKNLYFVGNQAVLLEQSEKELPKLLTFLQINPNIKVEIAGHINRPFEPPVSQESWNFKLSVRRAQTVYNYLRRNGIPSDRISYQGYGNSQMRYPRARTEKEQALNRRVEIKVLESN